MKQKKTKFQKLPKKSKEFFWSIVLEAKFEIPSAIENNDEPTLKQLTKFLLGEDGFKQVKNNLINETYEELK